MDRLGRHPALLAINKEGTQEMRISSLKSRHITPGPRVNLIALFEITDNTGDEQALINRWRVPSRSVDPVNTTKHMDIGLRLGVQLGKHAVYFPYWDDASAIS